VVKYYFAQFSITFRHQIYHVMVIIAQLVLFFIIRGYYYIVQNFHCVTHPSLSENCFYSW